MGSEVDEFFLKYSEKCEKLGRPIQAMAATDAPRAYLTTKRYLQGTLRRRDCSTTSLIVLSSEFSDSRGLELVELATKFRADAYLVLRKVRYVFSSMSIRLSLIMKLFSLTMPVVLSVFCVLQCREYESMVYQFLTAILVLQLVTSLLDVRRKGVNAILQVVSSLIFKLLYSIVVLVLVVSLASSL
ncbi:MAG: hypothetical protein DRJ40_05645 [Thermoprotei archaeon]|nr:MAG: hypothetical protein DRJ40_05645 [Thermoprotei archaeon]